MREEEKRHISSALHHEVGSIAVGIMARLSAAEDELRQGKKQEALGALRECRSVFGHAVNRLKKIAVELRPPDLDILGLRASLRHHFTRITRETPLKIDFADSTGGRIISSEIQTFLFRAAQECLNNVLKHANTSRARVHLSANGQRIGLSIVDNGKGFDPEALEIKQAGHLGLRAIQEMAASLGGRVNIASKPGQGTKISITVPHPNQRLQARKIRSDSGKEN